MSGAFQTLLFLLSRHAHREVIAENQFLKVQNDILKGKLGKKHIVLNHADRSRLMKFGKELKAKVKELLSVTTYRTWQRWCRAEREGVRPIWEDEDVEVVDTPIAAPNCNAFSESWIANLKRECLNWFTCFSLNHLDYIVHEYEKFHNTVRPHRGLGNSPPDMNSCSPGKGKVKKVSFLGGLLNHYYRDAA